MQEFNAFGDVILDCLIIKMTFSSFPVSFLLELLMLQLARSIGLECLNSFSGPFILLIGSDGLYETYKCLDRRCILSSLR